MPRNTSTGVYSLPSGNPVVTNTTIASTWANTTLSDIGNEITYSLSRLGYGGMLAPFLNSDGTLSAPGISFTAETGTGFYRNAVSDLRISLQGVPVVRFNAYPNNMQFTTDGGTTWVTPLLTGASLTYALAHATAGQVGIGITFTVVNFETVVTDTAGGITTGASWVYTVQAGLGGFYSVNVLVETEQVGGGGTAAQQLALYHNGSSILQPAILNVGAGTFPFLSLNWVVQCVPTDTLQVKVMTSGGTMDVIGGAILSTISIVKLA